MILVNKEGNDLSNEGYVTLAVLLEMMWAADIMSYQIADAMHRLGQRTSLVQRKRYHFNQARKEIERFTSHLEVAFDDTFNSVFQMVAGECTDRTNQVQYIANDIIDILLIYFSRGDGNPEKRTQMKKALLNFKETEGIDLNGLRKFFKFDI